MYEDFNLSKVFLSVDLIVKWDGAQLDQPAGQHQELGRGVPSLGHWPGPCQMVTREVTHSTQDMVLDI